jgi:hypothetical protein
VDYIRALLGSYAAWDDNSVPMFREKSWVPSAKGRKSKKNVGNVVVCLLPLL